jgi:sigma-B regulation protein RsbU (phosphoserine phosphatase)
MTLRAKLILLVVGTAVTIVATTLWLVNRRLTSEFTERARSDVRGARDVLDDSLAESLESYRVQAQIVADATLLKEALIRRSHELAFSYADSARDTVSLRYVAVLDANGRVIADAKNEFSEGVPLIAGLAAPADGEHTPRPQAGFMRAFDDLVAVAVAPVVMDQQVIGYVMLGEPVTPRRLAVASRVARADITIFGLGDEPPVSTAGEEGARNVARAWAGHRVAGPEAVTLSGVPHLMVGEPLAGLQGEPLGTIVVTRSLLDQERALQELRRWLLSLGIVFTLSASAAGALLAHRVAAGMRALTVAAHRIAQGDSEGPSSARAARPTPTVIRTVAGNEIETLSRSFDIMATAVAERQGRLQREMALAQQLQTAILPRRLAVAGLELSAAMIPATEVGGDYYDVLPTADGCWLGIGDVAGHGLNAGLTMLMIQSMVAALAQSSPQAAPSTLIAVLNDALCDNLRERLNRREHATLSLLKYDRSGRISYAGAHEDILIYRAATCEVETVTTSGIWVGIRRDIAGVTEDATFDLQERDVMVLYTDGVIEARDARKEMLGLDRLRAALAEAHDQPVDVIRDRLIRLVRDWTHKQDDDVTLLVARYVGKAGASERLGTPPAAATG